MFQVTNSSNLAKKNEISFHGFCRLNILLRRPLGAISEKVPLCSFSSTTDIIFSVRICVRALVIPHLLTQRPCTALRSVAIDYQPSCCGCNLNSLLIVLFSLFAGKYYWGACRLRCYSC